MSGELVSRTVRGVLAVLACLLLSAASLALARYLYVATDVVTHDAGQAAAAVFWRTLSVAALVMGVVAFIGSVLVGVIAAVGEAS